MWLVRFNKEFKDLATRQYLDATVVPVILQALTEVAKERYSLFYIDLLTP